MRKEFYFYYSKREFEHIPGLFYYPDLPKNTLLKILTSDQKGKILVISDIPLHLNTLSAYAERPVWLGENIKETKISLSEPEIRKLNDYLASLIIKDYVQKLSIGDWTGWAGEIRNWYEMFGKFWEK